MSINNILNREPTPSASQPILSNTYWPVLRDALLQDPSSYNNLHLECGICLENMTVFQHEHTYDPEMSHLSHRARIFPCGHMFGNCGHVHTGMPMPTTVKQIWRFPPTLSEGGVVANKCGDCQATEIIMGINYLAPTLLFPFELAEGDSLFVSVRTKSQVWDLRPTELVEGHVSHDLPVKGPLKRVFDEIKAKLKDSAMRSWYSADLRSFEIAIRLCSEEP
ncbi:unnamed protein product [Fusarium venenatum]|uniref:RING-type domain-containing protein n=1 Tax=Fusarium venenatum TaxID=56646 RepID=A0A2L2ST15_9HYPO|nr:uncharacterized protein FVRRES_11206 [Fusarium venenatum]CEI38515.1 unnamed protein product [Fusarium venenatum]